MSIQKIDRLLARGAPDATALIDRDCVASYADLDAMVNAVATRLIAEGLQPGDRAAVCAPKSIAMVAALFGVWRAGGVAVPINPVLRAGQVAHILANSGAVLLLTPPARGEALAEADALGTARVLDLDADQQAAPPSQSKALPLVGRVGWGSPANEHGEQSPAAHPHPAPPHKGEGEDKQGLAALLYTSGSTGRPKGVMLSHANLLLAAESVATYLALAADDRALAVLPLSFDAGLSVLTSALYAGASTVLLDYLVANDVVRAVERHRVVTLSGVPPLFVQLADADWPDTARASLRRLTVTGGRMPVRLTRRLRALFPQARLHLMYGLTEAFRSLSLDPALVDVHPGSVGRAIPHARVSVRRPDGSEAADDEPGELVHSGPLVAMGYWRNEAATTARFRPAPDGDGHAVWSGDTVRRDVEGLHYFVGRDDEMIKTSGLRVSPTDIEEAAHATGAVAEAAAFGVADERLGQTIVLTAVAAGDDADVRLARGLAQALPPYMRPTRVEWCDTLPRSPNGKIDRAALRATLSGEAGA